MIKNLSFGLFAVLGFAGSMALPVNVGAQTLLTAPRAEVAKSNNSDQPLIISADEALEWDRKNQYFTASMNALARQGTTSLAAGLLRAKYHENAESNFDIYHIHAQQNVVMRSDDTSVYGDEADYNLPDDLAIVTGGELRLEAPENLLTATQKFTYQPERGFFEAIGNARLETRNERGEVNVLEADRITANFADDNTGKRVLKKMNAYGNVRITTPQEILTADRGVYFADRRYAQVFDNVEIRRGPNILQGQEADIDLDTQISRMKGGAPKAGSDGRVRGVFYPGSAKK